MDAILTARGVVQEYPGVKALKGVDLTLEAGQVHALVGENGAGKSTLIRILGGIEQPKSGQLILGGTDRRFLGSAQSQEAGISVVSQEFRLIPELSIEDNVMLGHELSSGGVVKASLTRKKVKEVLDLLGVDLAPGRLVSTLTTGDQQMVEIARALSRDFDVLIMDEPTAALNQSEVEKLHVIVRRLAEQGKAILYVSHHLDEVFSICDVVTVLRDGSRVHVGPTGELDEPKLVEHMLGRPPGQFTHSTPGEGRDSGSGLVVSGIAISGLPHPFTLDVAAGEVVGLAGLVGSGRTELMRAIAGDLPFGAGTIEVKGRPAKVTSIASAIRSGIYMLSEDRKREGILPHLDVTENTMVSRDRSQLSPLRRVFPSRAKEAGTFARLKESLRIRVPDGRSLIGNLSGGNQQKVLLGRALEANCSVMLLNEPTRGVDVGAKLDIYDLIKEQADGGTAVLVSSSDVAELTTICDRCLVFFAGELVAELSGDDLTENNIVQASVGALERSTDE